MTGLLTSKVTYRMREKRKWMDMDIKTGNGIELREVFLFQRHPLTNSTEIKTNSLMALYKALSYSFRLIQMLQFVC